MPAATPAPLLLCALLTFQAEPPPGDPDAGFTPLFDGESLAGWSGDSRLWNVEDGVIVGRTSETNPAEYNTFLVSEQAAGDFDLRFEYKVEGYNSGVQYRSETFGDDGFRMKGPQCDIDSGVNYTGMFYDEGGLGVVARRGEASLLNPAGEKIVLGSLGDAAALQTEFVKPFSREDGSAGDDGWNAMRVLAVGDTTLHFVNGRLMAAVTDLRPDRPRSGKFGFQLHRGPPMALFVRDVRLKTIGESRKQASFGPVGEYLDGMTADGKIAGAVALVSRDGRTVYEHVTGDRVVGGAPMTADTLFRLASMTKPVTSVAVLQLAEAGKLDLSDPVGKFVPEFARVTVRSPGGPRPPARPVTVFDLLTHTGGLTYDATDGVANGTVPTDLSLADNAAKIAGRPLAFDPGSRWNYSLSTDVLGRVVEVASGERFDRYLRGHIFAPLGMDDTGFAVAPADAGRLAGLHAPGPDGRVRPVGGVADLAGWTVDVDAPLARDGVGGDDPGYLSGGAGLVGTAGDYLRFCEMLLNGGERDGARVLGEPWVTKMTTNRIGDLTIGFPLHGDGFGLGVGVLSEPFAAAGNRPEGPGAYGWAGLYLTYFWVDPGRKLAAVVMTQTLPAGAAADLRENFRDRVYEALK